MFILPLLKNQNMNLKMNKKVNRDWKANDRCVTSENIPVFTITQKVENSPLLVSEGLFFYFSVLFVILTTVNSWFISKNQLSFFHCACNRVVKFTCGSYVVNCKCILSLSVYSMFDLTFTHLTCMVVSHTWSLLSKMSRMSPLLLEVLKKWSGFCSKWKKKK